MLSEHKTRVFKLQSKSEQLSQSATTTDEAKKNRRKKHIRKVEKTDRKKFKNETIKCRHQSTFQRKRKNLQNFRNEKSKREKTKRKSFFFVFFDCVVKCCLPQTIQNLFTSLTLFAHSCWLFFFLHWLLLLLDLRARVTHETQINKPKQKEFEFVSTAFLCTHTDTYTNSVVSSVLCSNRKKHRNVHIFFWIQLILIYRAQISNGSSSKKKP